MSGGHWNYLGPKIQIQLEEIADDPAVKEHWPLVGRSIAAYAQWIVSVEHEMDWILSGDGVAFPRTQEMMIFELMTELEDAHNPRWIRHDCDDCKGHYA